MYPYIQVINGKNKNCFGNKSYDISYKFNPLYETKNLDEMLYPISLSLLIGFKVSNINNKKNGAYIKLILLSKYIEFYNANTKTLNRITFDELKNITKPELKEILLTTCKLLHKNTDIIVDDIYFIIDNYNYYMTHIINSDII